MLETHPCPPPRQHIKLRKPLARPGRPNGGHPLRWSVAVVDSCCFWVFSDSKSKRLECGALWWNSICWPGKHYNTYSKLSRCNFDWFCIIRTESNYTYNTGYTLYNTQYTVYIYFIMLLCMPFKTAVKRGQLQSCLYQNNDAGGRHDAVRCRQSSPERGSSRCGEQWYVHCRGTSKLPMAISIQNANFLMVVFLGWLPFPKRKKKGGWNNCEFLNLEEMVVKSKESLCLLILMHIYFETSSKLHWNIADIRIRVRWGHHPLPLYMLHDVEVDIFLPLPGQKSFSKGRPPNREGVGRQKLPIAGRHYCSRSSCSGSGIPAVRDVDAADQSPKVPMVQIQPRFMVCPCPLLERFHLWHHLLWSLVQWFWSLVQWFSTRLRQRQGYMGVARMVWQTWMNCWLAAVGWLSD